MRKWDRRRSECRWPRERGSTRFEETTDDTSTLSGEWTRRDQTRLPVGRGVVEGYVSREGSDSYYWFVEGQMYTEFPLDYRVKHRVRWTLNSRVLLVGGTPWQQMVVTGPTDSKKLSDLWHSPLVLEYYQFREGSRDYRLERTW